ncbi:MAG: AmmeMemoRadiSam system protein B [Candidatus Sedimenticola endophacoides]|uniref:MEMO1 family protein C3L24_02465 n=1 Tax=Candidatus Sedimenticola endophacoides TaxID=2548426 RepID=A0A657Q1F1_9GAMM|nr:MAG: AmmeMemoRadiSam system protein B [Candidatus Sedimenticola endophacoides]OQX34411.1 MAG: AmmeMemoRadiSam system protein B [Candidatus Sedimenticola endophacoides]OQX41800.1 MAG: AmmeMemoRadiSam system protein B [Candidatus Sedimenticola endophacoides]OQX44164.1 MAG: AmmeMemoRadiSam system protein B [Candidatus Sedimenticola endophacoides]OQX47326.1 MAG: AmmeMemoRadiSam system protein B [Candidatus Sedimenticola endophacoides]
MKKIHLPAVAGLFYPASPEQLRDDVRGFIAGGKNADIPTPKALIAPHAGYIYSGPIAGSAYAQLEEAGQLIKRVVLLAPSHRLAFHGIAYSSADYFQTPLGEVEVDTDALASITDLPQLHLIDQAFEHEHALEVHLPFLQESLPGFRLVPFLVGDAGGEEVEQLLERLWGGAETLIVISSDLSHYHEYTQAREMDSAATRAIEQLDPAALSRDHACGRNPIKGLLLAARRHHLRALTLDQRNSGDTAGPRHKVVGYGAYAFY